MMSSGINLVMTVIGFAVSIMFIVFVCTRLICARIQMSVSRRSLNGATRSDLSIVSTHLLSISLVSIVLLDLFDTPIHSSVYCI